MGTVLMFTSRELRLIREMEKRLRNVRTFEDIYAAIQQVMECICRADHLAVGFTHADGSRGLEWVAPTVQPLLAGYSPWAPRCFVYQYALDRPNKAAREPQMLAGRPLESTETYERSRAAGLKLRHVLATLLFETRRKFKGGLAMYRDTARAFTDRDEALLQAFIPLINDAVSTVQYIEAKGFKADLLAALSMESWPGMVLNAVGRRIEETGTSRAVVNQWFRPNELSHDVPKEWVQYVKWLSSLDGLLLPTEKPFADRKRGLNTLKVSFRASTVLRPGCTLWEVRIREELHWMREDWSRKLSPRQIQVADLMKKGARDEDIAQDLNLKLNTAKEHAKAVYRKTGAEGRLDLVTRGQRSE
ncbi:MULTISPECIES: helix-turn-helix transcriptional regulator [unclassified Corallococcus]|uniref:helix-turn-helix transcriptional regulator n=1 Tax=unclassified Corallococcus TaxID=2685029 RepID=UPI001A8D4036|nr:MULTISPECIES: helix-turn-helix transcriptional regulator [unclassified Corallococcus]MBN9687595.1 helix-turn-helix transcriptional regulator [Corallococcus sp. NCSPR001]WAS88586.1 helix-turn-helix transcriptional regulator [Corallococcus sp. NCRR]